MNDQLEIFARGPWTYNYSMILIVSFFTFWIIVLYVWRIFFMNTTIRVFSNVFMGTVMMFLSVALIYLLSKYLWKDRLLDPKDVDLYVSFSIIMICAYIFEMLIRVSEQKKVTKFKIFLFFISKKFLLKISRLIFIHHFLSIGLILIFVGPTKVITSLIPPQYLNNYYILFSLMGLVAAYDFVGEYGFLFYRLWRNKHKERVVSILYFLFWYGLVLRIVSHLLFMVFFALYHVKGKISGIMQWILLSIEVVFALIEYYYVFILLVIIKKLKNEISEKTKTENSSSNGNWKRLVD